MNHPAQMPASAASLAGRGLTVAIPLACFLVFAASAQAATLCVNQNGRPGCSTTIAAAVASAAPGDTIDVAAGVYHEDIVIAQSVSLIGASNGNTVIDATSLPNAVYVDGWDNANLQQVIITGFTIRNANFEGVLVQNADDVTVVGNIVTHNDQSLQPTIPACSGQPAFETSETNDCGEGIHLIGVTHSTVASNDIEQNAGGILISDETATSHDNIITRNMVRDNAFDCGITIASHPAYEGSGNSQLAYGIYNNVISDNDSIHNGFGSSSGGAGVGLFAPGPGNRTFANTVANNRLIDNSMPGIAIHNHVDLTDSGMSPNPDVNRNILTGNYISGNGADPDVPTTVATGISILGVAPVTDTEISNNIFDNEQIDVAMNSATTLNIHLNSFLNGRVGIDSINPAGIVNARENWWGCSRGPGFAGCSTVLGGASVIYTPWLTNPVDDTHGHILTQLFDDNFDQSCSHPQNDEHDLGGILGSLLHH